VEQFGAAPYGTMLLADLGAEVIKVENAAIGGDPSRKTGPFMLGENDSEYYQAFNINKKSVALDLRNEEGKAALLGLIASADALINNLRGDLPAKMGLDYKALSAVNPAIVCVHLSAYGRDNERASWPGYDYLMQAESGLMSLTGEPDGPPSRIGAPSMIDQSTGLTAAVGLLSGIVQARATGKGCDIDTCLLDVAVHQLGYVATWYLNEKHVSTRQRRSAHYSVAPVQTFPTSDGWVFIMCMTEKFWTELVNAIGRPELLSDPRFATPASRQAHRDALTELVDGELRKKSTEHWLTRLNGVLPIAPVLDLADALENPFLRSTKMIRDTPHPAKPDMRTLANPIRVNGQRLEGTVCSPLGADNAEYLNNPRPARRVVS
jgi:crotonobetainyl-CoA:carnitine CoA-transferase CaiB-like acyl-CoA transferase